MTAVNFPIWNVSAVDPKDMSKATLAVFQHKLHFICEICRKIGIAFEKPFLDCKKPYVPQSLAQVSALDPKGKRPQQCWSC